VFVFFDHSRQKRSLNQRNSSFCLRFVLYSMGAWSKKTQARRWAGDLAFVISEDRAEHKGDFAGSGSG
jgi:hypothetical protein